MSRSFPIGLQRVQEGPGRLQKGRLLLRGHLYQHPLSPQEAEGQHIAFKPLVVGEQRGSGNLKIFRDVLEGGGGHILLVFQLLERRLGNAELLGELGLGQILKTPD
jgi:hypothetical protein